MEYSDYVIVDVYEYNYYDKGIEFYYYNKLKST